VRHDMLSGPGGPMDPVPSGEECAFCNARLFGAEWGYFPDGKKGFVLPKGRVEREEDIKEGTPQFDGFCDEECRGNFLARREHWNRYFVRKVLTTIPERSGRRFVRALDDAEEDA